MICSFCNLSVTRKKLVQKKQVFWVDETRRFWDGRICPTCSKEHLQPIRQPERFCRACLKTLPADRYFFHSACAPHTESLDPWDINKQSSFSSLRRV